MSDPIATFLHTDRSSEDEIKYSRLQFEVVVNSIDKKLMVKLWAHGCEFA